MAPSWRRMSLHGVIASCLRQLQAEIQARDAQVTVQGTKWSSGRSDVAQVCADQPSGERADLCRTRGVARGYRGGSAAEACAALK